MNRRLLVYTNALLASAALVLSSCANLGGGSRTATSVDSKYSHQLHSRFYTAWQQPASVAATRGRITVVADVTVDVQGRVKKFKVVQPSGYREIDDSVRAAGRSVKQVEPPPLPTGTDRLQLRVYFDLDVRR
jgi:TonB family protein